MSSVILPSGIFPWELPVINRTTMSKLINNIISSYFEIDIVYIDFEYFLTFIIVHGFVTNTISILHSPWVLSLSILLVLKLFRFSTLSSLVQIILIFLWLILIPHWMFVHWGLMLFLLDILLLKRSHVILVVLIVIWRMISLVLHSHLLMVHGRSVTSILSSI